MKTIKKKNLKSNLGYKIHSLFCCAKIYMYFFFIVSWDMFI